MEGRVDWLRDRLTAGLEVNPDAFDRLLQDDNARNLVAVLLDGQIDDGDALPTLLFYTSQLEETAARLLAGKVVAPAPSDATATSPPSDDAAADAMTGEGEADAVDEASASAAVEEEASAKAEAGAAEPDGETQPSDDANEYTTDETALAPPLPPQTPPPPPPPPPPPLEPAELLQLHVWNVKYDFNDSDFAVSLRLVSTYLQKAHENGDSSIPWDTLRYLVGEVMYGGRVTDNCDRRVVATYMQEYLGDFLFDTFQPFHFYHDESVDYHIPSPQSRAACLAEIESMPGIEAQTPEVFGLHPNAEIDYLTNSSKKLWRDLLDLQPRTASSGGGITREDYISSIATDLESKIPPPFDLNKLRKDLEADGFSPVFVVLVQELERWEQLNVRMAKTLGALKRALSGEIAMSSELDELGNNLFNGQLPDLWRKLTPATDKMLGSWVVFHLRRHAQYAAWVESGEPKVMWLSGLQIPETYTAALVQTTCRRYGWPLDKSSLYTKVTSFTSAAEIGERLQDGCYVEGLYLEGAAWDATRRCLCRQPPKVLVQELPIVQIIPVELSKLRLQGTIRVPLYITQQRRNAMGVGLMMECDVDTADHESHWVLQGTALVMNTDQ